ncbi:MAG: molybdopterin-dependent oxidoreductase, partial [Phreatobacter sp.]|nr:molybdopterin-dependent oxidoreductase [Phreatobacter sp.]
AVNEEWISDKTRHVADGLRSQRLDRPYIRENGRLRPATWPEAFEAIAAKVKATARDKIGAIAGDMATLEEMYALKGLVSALGSQNIDGRQDGVKLDPALGRATYVFNPGIAGIEEADAILLVGTNPRREAPLVNARIRKRWRMGGVKIAVIGEVVDLTYRHDYLGAGPDTLADVVSGKHSFAEVLKGATKPLVIVGQGALARADGAAILSLAAHAATAFGAVAEGWNGFAVLHTAASRVGALDLGLVPGEGGLDAAAMAGGGVDLLFNLGADEIAVADGPFVVYVGTHGDRGAHRADVILPGAAYTEKAGLTANTEGRIQVVNRAGFPPGDAKEDWAILRALSDVLGVKLPYDSLQQLRVAMAKDFPHTLRIGALGPVDAAAIGALAGKGGKVEAAPFAAVIDDFYMTNPIARASGTMAECSAIAKAAHRQAAE